VQFDKLMTERAVVPYFQPIVSLADLSTVAYEVLGRSRLFGLETPRALFSAAAQLNLEVELSRMFRWEGVEASAALPELPHLFVNTHPAEMVEPGLLDSIRAVRESHPAQPITLEIHEASVTAPAAMRELRARLRDLEVGLAYDDFGAGQARMVELVEVRPDYLKFDMELVQGIHAAAPGRQQMLATLVRMVRELEIVPLAEGVEYEAESDACRQLGFQLAQGFFYGRPAPISRYAGGE
jgi:EAL domain-containing protein (putative c-di-GMP-specific phosphodiesterase class I)